MKTRVQRIRLHICSVLNSNNFAHNHQAFTAILLDIKEPLSIVEQESSNSRIKYNNSCNNYYNNNSKSSQIKLKNIQAAKIKNYSDRYDVSI